MCAFVHVCWSDSWCLIVEKGSNGPVCTWLADYLHWSLFSELVAPSEERSKWCHAVNETMHCVHFAMNDTRV